MADKIKFRRGLSSNRLTQLPEPGEPLFDTDTRKLYIGDGITPGGLSITGGSSTSYLNELLDVSTDGVQDGQVLVWSDTESKFIPSSDVGSDFSGDYNDLINKPTIVDVIDDLSDVNTFGATDGQVLTYRSETNDWVPLDSSTTSVENFFKSISTDDSLVITANQYEDQLQIVGGTGIETSSDASNKILTISYTGGQSFASLSDTTITSPSNGQVAMYNGSSWINTQLSYNNLTDLPNTAASLNELTDVTLSSLLANQVLTYDGTKFTNALIDYSIIVNKPTIPETLHDLGDVTLGTLSTGQILSFNGTVFVNKQMEYSDIANTPSIPTNISELTNDSNYSTVTTLSELTDTTISTPVSGNVLRHDGTDWKNSILNYDDLSNTPTFGTAAFENTTTFATASQGAKADTALQDLTSSSIIELSDTPSSWGTSGQALIINGTGDGLVFSDISSGEPTQNIFNTITSDSGSTTADSTTDTLSIVGGTGISTSITGDIVTINSTLTDQNLFETIETDSGSVVAGSSTDTLSVIGGTGIETSVVDGKININSTLDVEKQNLFETIIADTGSTTADSITDSLTITGTNGIETSIIGDSLTINYIGETQSIFETINTDDGSVVAASTTDTLDIIGGQGIETKVVDGKVNIIATGETNSTDTISSGTNIFATYSAATNTGIWMDYVVKTSTGVQMGSLYIANDTSTVSIADTGTKVGVIDITFTAAINAGNIEVSYTSTDTGNISWTTKGLQASTPTVASASTVFETFSADIEAAIIDYVYKSTTDDVKMGTLYIASNGTTTSISDTGIEIGTVDITFSSAINTGNVEVSYTSSEEGNISWTLKNINI